MSKIYVIQPPCFVESGQLNVTSDYGNRTDPVTGKVNSFHAGVDCTLWVGWSNLATIAAMADGTVVEVYDKETGNSNYSNARGNYVVVKHNDTYCTLYQHLQKGARVAVGQVVKKGQAIGNMGNTGKSTGAHLHVEVHENGATTDPLPFLLGEKSVEGGEIMYFNIVLNKDLKKGDLSEEVAKLQVRVAQISPEYEAEVKSHSFSAAGQPDGSFGPSMVKTMEKLQAECGVPVTGILDAATRVVLNSNLLTLQKRITDARKALE